MTLDRLQSRLALLRLNLQALDTLAAIDEADFHADFRNLDSALHRLQTSIQVLIGLASFLSARLGLAPASTSRGVLDGLEAAGALPAGAASRYGPLLGFRNRVVHVYDTLDAGVVYRVLTEERADLEALLAALMSGLSRAPR